MMYVRKKCLLIDLGLLKKANTKIDDKVKLNTSFKKLEKYHVISCD